MNNDYIKKEEESITTQTNFKDLILNKDNSIEIIKTFHFLIKRIISDDHYKKNCIFNILKPKISLYDYIGRILKYCKLHITTLIFSLVYIDRLPDDFILTENNSYKMVLTCILIASKLNEDLIHSNLYFSKVGGINLFEINLLENDLLNLIKFNLHVDEITFEKYKKYFKKIIH